MTKDEALKMAIEALESITLLCDDKRWYLIGNARKACKEALEQPSVAELNDEYLRDTYVQGLSQPAQEPVAWIKALEIAYIQSYKEDERVTSHGWRTNLGLKPEPDDVALYTRPAPSWQGLSDDEISKVIIDEQIPVRSGKTANRFARAIEQALKEKNT